MTETLEYVVVNKSKQFEIRRYPEHIRAEVKVPGSNYQNAIYQGFSILARYIFGDNIDTETIAMTSPVQVSNSKKIEMTTPVSIRFDGTFNVAFIMPTKYTLETLPKPMDHRITIIKTDSEILAAHRFSGYFSENKVNNAKRRLQGWVEHSGLEAIGDFIIARYNPPWVPWFLARNEVMIPIKPISEELKVIS